MLAGNSVHVNPIVITLAVQEARQVPSAELFCAIHRRAPPDRACRERPF